MSGLSWPLPSLSPPPNTHPAPHTAICPSLPTLYPIASPTTEAMPFQGSHPLSRDATLPNISVFPSRVKGFRSIFVSKPPPPLTTVGFFALPGQALPLDPKHFRFNLDDLHCFPRFSSLPTHLPPSVNLHPSILSFSLSLPLSLLLCLLPRSVPPTATIAPNPSSS